MIEFVLVEHSRLALHAAVIFAAGLFAAWPVVRFRLHGVAWLPRQTMRFVTALMGRGPSIFRMTLIIFLFNSAVMFIQLASGFHPFVPKLFGLWTGLNVGIMTFMTSPTEMPSLSTLPKHGWVPSPNVTVLSGLLVLARELPSYGFTLAMRVTRGHEVQSGVFYTMAFSHRVRAYALIIVPALLVSAAAEAVSIRGSVAHMKKNAEDT